MLNALTKLAMKLKIGLNMIKFKLTFTTPEKTTTVEADENQTIYEAFEKNGLELPHGCLAGSCGACRINVTNGATNLKPAGAIESDTVNFIKTNLAQRTGDQSILQQEVRLSCRAKFTGDVTFTKI